MRELMSVKFERKESAPGVPAARLRPWYSLPLM